MYMYMYTSTGTHVHVHVHTMHMYMCVPQKRFARATCACCTNHAPRFGVEFSQDINVHIYARCYLHKYNIHCIYMYIVLYTIFKAHPRKLCMYMYMYVNILTENVYVNDVHVHVAVP